MDRVRGTLPIIHQGQGSKLKEELEKLGYEFSEDITQLSFQRLGLLESVLAEVTPLVEEGGWDAKKDLYLEQNNPEKAAQSIYEKGRILRVYPHF